MGLSLQESIELGSPFCTHVRRHDTPATYRFVHIQSTALFFPMDVLVVREFATASGMSTL